MLVSTPPSRLLLFLGCHNGCAIRACMLVTRLPSCLCRSIFSNLVDMTYTGGWRPSPVNSTAPALATAPVWSRPHPAILAPTGPLFPAAALCAAFIVALSVGFNHSAGEQHSWLSGCDWFGSAVYILDIVVNFNTGIVVTWGSRAVVVRGEICCFVSKLPQLL